MNPENLEAKIDISLWRFLLMNEPERATTSRLSQRQNFFQLFCIQTVSTGPPALIIGKQLSDQYGAGTAICSIFIGSLILWMIGLAIVSMVYQQHTNAIENIKGYIGKWGALLFALILVLAFINWYVIEIKTSIIGLDSLFQSSHPWSESLVIRIGAVLGIIAALLAIGGIRFLKWLTVAGFPFMICYYIYAILISDYSLFSDWKWGLSFSGIVLSILVNLPGVINLPTFFRHSRSKADSFLALTFMVIFFTFFECGSIWMNFSSNSLFIWKSTVPPDFLTFILPTALFLILTSTCSNLLNIYLASACYETFIPRFQGTKGHAIMGLLGTAAYTFVQISSPLQFLENLLNCYIGVLGVVLLIGVLSRIIIKHRPRKFERSINMVSWLIGCAVSSTLIIQNPGQGNHSLLLGMGASTLFFLFVFFIEETYWSAQKIKSGRRVGGNME